MKYSYYPACCTDASGAHFARSVQAVCRELKVELAELEDWNCCGATAYFAVDDRLALSISARNLALAARNGGDLVTFCAGCFTTLRKAHEHFVEDDRSRREIQKALEAAGLSYDGSVRVRHVLDVFVNDIGFDGIRSHVKRPLAGLRVAPYYGCQIVRPGPTFDDPEMPTSLDHLLVALGAEPVPFALKTRCCGGMLMTTSEPVALELVHRILACADQGRADAIAIVCPLCNMNLEGYQGKVNKAFGTRYRLPVLPFTHFMGVAFGLPPKEIGLGQELVSAKQALAAYL